MYLVGVGREEERDRGGLPVGGPRLAFSLSWVSVGFFGGFCVFSSSGGGTVIRVIRIHAIYSPLRFDNGDIPCRLVLSWPSTWLRARWGVLGQYDGELAGVGVTHLRTPALSLWPLGGCLRHFHGVRVHRPCVFAGCRGGCERWAAWTMFVGGFRGSLVVHIRAIWGCPGVQGSEHAAVSTARGWHSHGSSSSVLSLLVCPVLSHSGWFCGFSGRFRVGWPSMREGVGADEICGAFGGGSMPLFTCHGWSVRW